MIDTMWKKRKWSLIGVMRARKQLKEERAVSHKGDKIQKSAKRRKGGHSKKVEINYKREECKTFVILHSKL